MRLNLRRIFRLNLRAVKSRSIPASGSIGMSAYPGSPPPSDPAGVFWIWTGTACFSAGAVPPSRQRAVPPGAGPRPRLRRRGELARQSGGEGAAGRQVGHGAGGRGLRRPVRGGGDGSGPGGTGGGEALRGGAVAGGEGPRPVDGGAGGLAGAGVRLRTCIHNLAHPASSTLNTCAERPAAAWGILHKNTVLFITNSTVSMKCRNMQNNACIFCE